MESLLLGIAGSVILLLIGALSYFIARYFSKQDEALKEQRDINKELNGSILSLNGVISELNTQLMLMNQRVDTIETNCDRNHNR